MRLMRIIALFILFLAPAIWAMEFTPAEREYIKNSPPLRVGLHPTISPFEEITNDGEAVGICVDLLHLIAEHCGLTLKFIPTKTFTETLLLAQQNKIDVVNSVNETVYRDRNLLFTEPFLTDPNVLITRADHDYIDDLSLLKNHTAAIVRDSARAEFMRKYYQQIHLIYTDTEAETLTLLLNKKVDFIIRSMMVASSMLIGEPGNYLRISGYLPADLNNCLRIGVVDNNQILCNILDKGIKEITATERSKINSKHLRFFAPLDYRLIAEIVGVSILMIGGMLYLNLRLRRYNALLIKLAQTDKLTKLYNRTKIDELSRHIGELAIRYSRPTTVMMLDIDFFKKVNDESGHQMGDLVLIAIAQNIQNSIRNVDHAGRWGGEEFIVLCPETTMQDGKIIAERIRQTIENSIYPDGKIHTVSIGIAQLQAKENMEKLLARADLALYEAKHHGRNRVISAE